MELGDNYKQVNAISLTRKGERLAIIDYKRKRFYYFSRTNGMIEYDLEEAAELFIVEDQNGTILNSSLK